MLRFGLFVIISLIATYYALQAPFYAMLFYLGNAYFRPEDWVGSDFVRSLHLSLVIGLYVIISSIVSRQRFVWQGGVALLWLFLFVAVLSCSVSEYSTYGWPYLIEFAKVISITYLVVVLTTSAEKFRAVILVMVFGLGLEAARQGWFYLLTSPGGANYNPIAFLGDNNGTAVGMLMLVPLIGFLIQTTQRKWQKCVFIGLLIGCLYRALSTYSRGGFLAAITMAVIWCLRSRNRLRNVVVTAMMLAIVMVALPETYWKRMQTIETYEKVQDESAIGRLHFWSVAADMAARNAILGVGFNSYNIAYDAYDFSDGKYGHGRSVHNSFLGVLAELGYSGFLLYLLIFFRAFVACEYVRRFVSRTSIGWDLEKGTVAIETSLVVFVVGGSFVPMQYNEMVFHLLGLSMVLRRLLAQQEQLLSMPNSREYAEPPLERPLPA